MCAMPLSNGQLARGELNTQYSILGTQYSVPRQARAGKLPMAPCTGRLIGLALFLFTLAGCSQDEITQYRAPKDPPLPKWAGERGPRQRMLAAIISHDEKTWFFKFIGPDELVT